MLTVSLIAFGITYLLMICLDNYRHWVALASAVFFTVMKILPLGKLSGAIDYNILMMLFGTMGTVYFFTESKMPNKMAEGLLSMVSSTKWAIIILSLFAGIISAFMDNVATVLMIAPIGLAVAKELDISPIEMIICIAVSANLQGAATLVGDTTSIMLGGYANMDFMDFFFMNGKFGIFWAVELGAFCTIPVIAFLFRKLNQPVAVNSSTKVTDYFPSLALGINIILLITASFFSNKPEITNGLICVGVYLVVVLYYSFIKKGTFNVKESFMSIDFKTLLLLASLFVIIGAITEAGVMELIAQKIIQFSAGNSFLIYSILVWGSVIISAFIDNIPYVATMLPVVQGIAMNLGIEPYALYFGLLTGATLGGNITPIGASANITGIGILRNNGYTVKNKDFFKIGVPFTLVAVTVGYIYIWLIWGI